MMLGTKIGKLESKLAKTKEDLKIYEKKAKEVDEMKNQLDLLKMKMDVIANLEKDRKQPLEIIDELSRSIIPKRMWLKEVVSDKSVDIKGFAMDNQTVAEFMKNLEKSKYYNSVNLRKIQQQIFKNSSNLRYFEVTCEKKVINNIKPKKDDQVKK